MPLPQVSLGTAVLIIFLVCAGFVMLRGMTRVITGSVVLALSAWAGLLVWQNVPALSVACFGKSIGFINTGVPIVVFLIAWLLLRKIIKAVARPFGYPADHEKKSLGDVIGLGFRLLLALIPTTIICIIAMIFAHHAGSVADVRAYSQKSHGKPAESPATYSQQLKSSIEAVIPPSWLDKLDPLAESSRLTLAKMITARSESPNKPMLDPKTGKPIPRAIVVDDPELQNLAREGKFDTLLRHPLLTKALDDPKIQSLIKELHF